jgi:hypothetical protein
MDRAVAARLLQSAISGPRRLLAWIGWALLAVAFFLALRADAARREWIRVEGEIVDFTEGETRAPIVDYQTPDGETRQITGDVSTNPRAGEIGDRVPVLINPDDPETVRLGTLTELWFIPGFLGSIGAIFLLIGTLSGGGVAAGRLPGQLSARRLQTLRETGERVMARVTAIIPVGAGASSRVAAHWRLQAQAINPRSGAPTMFVSQPISVDPSPHVKVGDEIGVFVDRDNPKIYAFDFTMLPFGS